jgi:hypothetical protein
MSVRADAGNGATPFPGLPCQIELLDTYAITRIKINREDENNKRNIHKLRIMTKTSILLDFNGINNKAKTIETNQINLISNNFESTFIFIQLKPFWVRCDAILRSLWLFSTMFQTN